MNKKAFIEDINFMFLGLALVGGMIAFGVSSYGGAGSMIKIASFILTTIVAYFYLTITE